MKKMISTEERELLTRNFYVPYCLEITEDMWNEEDQSYKVVFDKFVPASFFVKTKTSTLKHPEGMLSIYAPFSLIVNGNYETAIYADACTPQHYAKGKLQLGYVLISGGLNGGNNYYMLIGQTLFFNFFANEDI